MGYNRPYFCKMAKTKNNALSYKIKKIRRPNYQELRSNVEYYSPLEYASGKHRFKTLHNKSSIRKYRFNTKLLSRIKRNYIISFI